MGRFNWALTSFTDLWGKASGSERQMVIRIGCQGVAWLTNTGRGKAV